MKLQERILLPQKVNPHKQYLRLTITFSIIIHLVLFVTLNQQTELPEKIKSPKQKAIKSYLYKPSVKVTKPSVEEQKVKNPENETVKTELIKTDEPLKKSADNIEIVQEKTLPQDFKQDKTSDTEKTKNKLNNQPRGKHSLEAIAKSAQVEKKKSSMSSAMKYLSSLKENINEKALTEGFNEFSRHRASSAMHDAPEPIQKSATELNPTIKPHEIPINLGAFSIMKDENGNCTLEEDLSFIGLDNHKARSSFNCGPTKMERDFKAHMKKVREKFEPKIPNTN